MKSAITTAVPEEDRYEAAPSDSADANDVERWNTEWLAYLSREWKSQLTPHADLPLTPPLPEDPLDLLNLRLREDLTLRLYCDREALENKRTMELGCGCGHLGKQLGRYVESYLGVDFSTMALQVARLVSPANCTYVHVDDRDLLVQHHGRIDTVVGRYFWSHQNLQLAGRNLDFLADFLPPGGRIYTDFFWPAPDAEHFVVLSPDDALSKNFPSAMFRYEGEDVARLIESRPYRIIRETISTAMERRYVVFERMDAPWAADRRPSAP